MTAVRQRMHACAIALLLSIAGCCRGADSGAPAGPPSATPSAMAPDAPCPARFIEVPDFRSAGDRSCTCPAGPGEGDVRGSGIYTPDSAICPAAVHAGAVPRQGGIVKFRSAQGCPSYLGSTNNGVSTRAADRSDLSFYFPSVSDGLCGGR